MTRQGWLWLALGGAALAWALSNTDTVGTAAQDVGDTLQTGAEDVTAAIAGWKAVNQGPAWVPVLNGAESQFGIPPDLLARIAYQESHFRDDIISGAKVSSAGALGLMQLEPQYFSTVRVVRPFSASDTAAQIQQAAQELQRLNGVYNDWGLAVAAYNDGEGNVDKYLAGTHPLPAETIDYVSEILADVPLNGATVPA
jgi:soluble lytic murein transglycosylase-like protein